MYAEVVLDDSLRSFWTLKIALRQPLPVRLSINNFMFTMSNFPCKCSGNGLVTSCKNNLMPKGSVTERDGNLSAVRSQAYSEIGRVAFFSRRFRMAGICATSKLHIKVPAPTSIILLTSLWLMGNGIGIFS